MAAPKASVEAPANAPNMREASRLRKLLDTAPQILQHIRRQVAITNTGLLPKYKAQGTQKKFYRKLHQPSIDESAEAFMTWAYTKAEC